MLSGSGGAATQGARLCPPRTSRSGPKFSEAPSGIREVPCDQPAAVGAPRTQPRSGKNPRVPRRFWSAGGPRPQRPRTCESATYSKRPGSMLPLRPGTGRAPLGLRLRRSVLQLRRFLARREEIDRGRDKGLNLAPPSEPDGRISRIRLSSQWVRSCTIVRVHSCAVAKDHSPERANHAFGQRWWVAPIPLPTPSNRHCSRLRNRRRT